MRQQLVLFSLNTFGCVVFSKFSMTVRMYLGKSLIVLPRLDLMSETLRVILIGGNVSRQVTWTESNIVTELRIRLG